MAPQTGGSAAIWTLAIVLSLALHGALLLAFHLLRGEESDPPAETAFELIDLSIATAKAHVATAQNVRPTDAAGRATPVAARPVEASAAENPGETEPLRPTRPESDRVGATSDTVATNRPVDTAARPVQPEPRTGETTRPATPAVTPVTEASSAEAVSATQATSAATPETALAAAPSPTNRVTPQDTPAKPRQPASTRPAPSAPATGIIVVARPRTEPVLSTRPDAGRVEAPTVRLRPDRAAPAEAQQAVRPAQQNRAETARPLRETAAVARPAPSGQRPASARPAAVRPTDSATDLRADRPATAAPSVRRPAAAKVERAPTVARPNTASRPSATTAIRPAASTGTAPAAAARPAQAAKRPDRVAALSPSLSQTPSAVEPQVNVARPEFNPLEALKAFDAGACTLILPQTADASGGSFAAYGTARDRVDRFSDLVGREAGTDVPIAMNRLAREQCGAADFVRALPNYPAFDMRIRLEGDNVPDGGFVRGAIDNIRSRVINLVLIDDDGDVSVVNNYLSVSGGKVSIEAPIHLTEAAVETAQMFLAIGSDAPLQTLETQEKRPAAEFFKALTYEVVVRGVALDVAVAGFRVQ
ncbi:MAG: hypothetical protein AAGL24_09325 [Pseudomonadota bacterium]